MLKWDFPRQGRVFGSISWASSHVWLRDLGDHSVVGNILNDIVLSSRSVAYPSVHQHDDDGDGPAAPMLSPKRSAQREARWATAIIRLRPHRCAMAQETNGFNYPSLIRQSPFMRSPLVSSPHLWPHLLERAPGLSD